MNHLIDTHPQDPNSDDEKVADPEFSLSEEPKDLKLLEILIDKIIERLEDNTCQPRIQDALKAIQLKQKQVKTSEAEKIFWQEIEAIRSEELPKLYPEPIQPTCSERSESNSLESQILKTIIGLKDQVKSGILPVKTITDTFNQEKSKESQSQDPAFRLTYPRIGRILSTMGFRKAKTGNGASAIIWDEGFIYSLSPSQKTESAIGCDKKGMKPSSEPSETSETSEPSEAKEAPSPSKGDRQEASPDQVENHALRQASFGSEPSFDTESQDEVQGRRQGGDSSASLTVPEQSRRERSRTTRGGGEVKPNLFLCPPSFWSHRH